jgi:hypothetical protein
MWKLMSVEKSPKIGKKWRANFYDKENDKRKHTDFGAAGMDDYTITGDLDRKRLYQERHKKDLDTGDYTRAGFLSYYLLWNKPTLRGSIADFRKRFHA